MRKAYRSMVNICLALILCGLAASLLLYFAQDRLVWYPQRISPAQAEAIGRLPRVRELSLRTGDGIEIRGWLLERRQAGPNKILLYFGGNAEEVSHNIPEFLPAKDLSVVLFNYRGYGQSQGSPNERDLCRDALMIYDRIVGSDFGDSARVIVMGRSIGTGVAVHLAGSRRTDGVILVSPYQDFKTLAQIHFPYLPARLIAKYSFNSAALAPGIKAPLLVMIGTEDATIPPAQSRLLAQKWGGPVTIKEFEGADHNNLSTYGEYWKTINDFISTI